MDSWLVVMMYVRGLVSYAAAFMIGCYVGSGGCIDRLLGPDENRLERTVQEEYSDRPGCYNYMRGDLNEKELR